MKQFTHLSLVSLLFLIGIVTSHAQVANDNFSNAITVQHQANWSSALAAYTTVGATADGNAASCWNTAPSYNVWFKFVATDPVVKIGIKRGGSYGNIRRINAALWEADGTTGLACHRYVYDNDNVFVQYLNLTVGDTYYIAVDNYGAGYRGSFTLTMDNTVDYDFYEGAITVQHQANWSSAQAAYTTIGATADRNAAGCWNTAPSYNRWFKFVATSPVVKLGIIRGGSYGSIRRINAAIWEADGTTEIACHRYVYDNDNVYVQYLNLTVGDTYYIAVDNYGAGYRGSFTLTMDTTVDYDFYEGAKEIPSIVEWCSPNAAYTTIGATADRNAASCWNTSPFYNRWFKFQATSTGKVIVTALRGGAYGSLRRINLALWEADGITEITCNRYVYDNDNVTIQTTALTPGNTYYISIDNYGAGYRGSFTLCLDDDRIKWLGTTDSDWATPTNWSGGIIPTTNDDISISSGRPNYPIMNSGSNAFVKSLTIKPQASLTIPSGKSLTVINELILESDATGNASLIDQGTLNYNSSKSSYQTYLTEDKWHLISSPITDAKSGIYTDTYLSHFTETDSVWHYIPGTNDLLIPGKGYASWAASWLTGATTVTYHGEFNTGDITAGSLSYTPIPGAGDGWNLVGNPYPSAIEWNTNWTMSNVDPTVYVLNSAVGQYLNWNANTSIGTMGDGEIPPAQGFWVKANANSPSLTIPQSERIHTDKNFYKNSKSTNNILSLSIFGNGYGDKMIVGFNKEAKENFDYHFDAYKLVGLAAAPQLYSTKGNDKLSMLFLPESEQLIVPINLSVEAKNIYTITVNDIDSFDPLTDLFLEDLKENVIINLRHQNQYEFVSQSTDKLERFKLHFAFNTENQEIDKAREISIYSSEKTIYVDIPDMFTGDIEVYTVMGKRLLAKEALGGSLNTIKLPNNEGIFIVRVIGLTHLKTKKVYIK